MTRRRRVLRFCGVAGAGTLAGCPTPFRDSRPPPSDSATRRAKLTAADGESLDRLGNSVAVSGDGTAALVGAKFESAAHVFASTDGTWTQRAELTADDGDANDRFGSSVALSKFGATALVGASRGSDPNSKQTGSAHVFAGSDGSWARQTEVTPAHGNRGDRFGSSVALSDDGTTGVVGADSDGSIGERTGSAYVFEAGYRSWTQQTKLPSSDGITGGFGLSVATSSDGTTALVGGDEPVSSDLGGSAYVFDATGGSWNRTVKLSPDGPSRLRSEFGTSVALSNDGATALVGGRGPDSAYVFDGSGESWSERAELLGTDTEDQDKFGSSVALSGDGTTAVVGAESDDNSNGDLAGAAYVFEAGDGSWTQRAKLTADDGDAGDSFGGAVAVSNDGSVAVVGAEHDDNPNGTYAGAAYVFTL